MTGARYFDGNRTDLKRRPRDGSARRVWQVAQLWDNHKEVARRLALGQKNVTIATAVGMTPMAISNIKNSPVTQEYVANLQGVRNSDAVDILANIREMAPRALKLLDDIIQGKDAEASPALKANVAKDILDRAGYSAVKNLNVRSVHAIVSPADLEAIKKRALEIAEGNQVVVNG
jgi:hypothetical protein